MEMQKSIWGIALHELALDASQCMREIPLDQSEELAGFEGLGGLRFWFWDADSIVLLYV